MDGDVAQLVERLLCKEEVRSSSLLVSTVPLKGLTSKVRAQGEGRSTRCPFGPVHASLRGHARASSAPLQLKRKTPSKASFANGEPCPITTCGLASAGPRGSGWMLEELGQANKGARWMPWRKRPMKDAVTCDKVRGAGSKRRSGHFRMGEPDQVDPDHPHLNT